MKEKEFDNLIFEQSRDTAVLTFNRNLTVDDSSSLRSALMRSIENSEHVIINFADSINIDSVCLQILCMAMKISKRLRKFIILTGNLAENIKQKIENNNFDNLSDCDLQK